MTGICIVGGGAEAEAVALAMLKRGTSCSGEPDRCVVLPGIALGWSTHRRLPSDFQSIAHSGDLTVLVEGDIFDESAPLERPAEAIADLCRTGQADRIAWLNGSFVAIIVDRASGEVMLASDRLGSRPLFVWHGGSGFAAASRLEALLADPRVPRQLSRQGMLELVTLQRTAADRTHYDGVRAMSGSELWTFRNGSLERRRTRRLAWTRPDFDEREGVERLALGLTRAAARRTADPVRHGILLSGGLDARLVLGAAARAGRVLPCLTAGTFRNAEVALAERTAHIAGAPFRYLENPPGRLIDALDPSTAASDGLFTAPVNLFNLLPEFARHHDVLLSGHGLDYTLRGYYLPCEMVRLAGSTTRLPRLRSIPDGTPETLARNLRVGIKDEAVEAILRPALRREIAARKVAAFRSALAGAEIEDPYDAWDAYILSCLGRHYAYSDFVAMESVVRHRALAFDPEVFDLYLAMPPAWRASGRIAQGAMVRLAPDLMRLPDANTGIRASRGFPAQIALVFLRAALRRLGFRGVSPPPQPTMSHGSWANFPELLRRDPGFLSRLDALPRNSALLDTGLFEAAGLAAIVDQHLRRAANHVKLLLQMLTLASWLGRNGYEGVAAD